MTTNICFGQTMQLSDWERKYFEKELNNPFIFLIVYGEFEVDFKISKTKYRTAGIPDGIDLMGYGPNSNPEIPASFLEGYLWEELKKTDAALALKLEHSEQCYILRGELTDRDNLNYLRDIIGLCSYLLDNGGVGIYDPQMFTFWNKHNWNKRIFEPNAAVPRNHVLILHSEEEEGTKWFHTRGMRKFGRPDLSIHGVPEQHEEAIIDLFNRFIEYQAFGGIIADEQKINMVALPSGMWCKNQGDFEDPDFNNKHIEILWK